MYRLKSHLWPACTTCYLHKTLKSFVKYVRGRGDEAPGGAPGGRCPKCRTVTRRLQSGAHFGRCSLITFVYSSAKSKKMRTQKGVKSGKPVKYDLSRKVAMRPKNALFAKAEERLEICVKYVIFAAPEDSFEKHVKHVFIQYEKRKNGAFRVEKHRKRRRFSAS